MARNALGRGLGALIRELEGKRSEPAPPAIQPQAAAPGAAAPAGQATQGGAQEIDIDLIEPSPYQPRTKFHEQALDELARSIKASGIIQPLVLRPIGSRFQLIAGERRWRAAQRAGLGKVTAIVKQVPDELALEMTLVENIQREDLNPIEAARAFERLMDEFHLTQEAVAERTGKDRATVANAVRLLKLDKPIQEWIEEGKLSAGHGRALLAVPEQQLRMRYAHRASRGGKAAPSASPGAPRPEHQKRDRRAATAPGHENHFAATDEDTARAISRRVLRRQAVDGALRSADEVAGPRTRLPQRLRRRGSRQKNWLARLPREHCPSVQSLVRQTRTSVALTCFSRRLKVEL